MSTATKTEKNTYVSTDSEFVRFFNNLNDSIKEFYNIAKFNAKELNSFLGLFESQWTSISSLLNNITSQNKEENIEKILDNITECKIIINQLKNNSNLNLNNLNSFFGNAKLLLHNMREQRKERLKKNQLSFVSESYSNNKNNKNEYYIDLNNITYHSLNTKEFPVQKVYYEKKDYDKLFNLIIKLKVYSQFIENSSSKEKNNFLNLQRNILNILVKGQFIYNNKYLNSEKDFQKKNEKKNEKTDMNLLEIKTKYENEIKKLNNKIKKFEKNYENIVLISNKAKKFAQLKYKLEMELIKDNNYNNYNNNILKDEDLEENITNLIKLKKILF